MSQTSEQTPPVSLEPIKQVLGQSLQGREAIRFAILYGSAAEGRSFRDLDIGVFVNRAVVPAEQELMYGFSLADELETMVSYPVDLWVINDAPLAFRYNVSRGIVLVANDRECLATFREHTWRDYLDFQPFAMEYLRVHETD